MEAAATTPIPVVARRGYWRQSLHRIGRQPLTLSALAVLVTLFVLGGLASVLAPHGWNWIDLSSQWRNHPPTLTGGHLLGTDNIGRDTIQRTLWGLHFSEQTALAGAAIAALVGLLVGGLAGYYTGWIDTSLMRIADLITGLPVFVLMLVTFAFLQPVTLWKAIAVFSGYMWTLVARVVRARVAALRAEPFVEAAIAAGASDTRILLRHLLPNAAGATIIAATTVLGQIALVEAAVEFFGFGVPSLIRPTLGNLIADSTMSGIGDFNYLGLGWWVWAGPVIILVLILVCTNLIGDGLDTALNPRAQIRRSEI